MPTASTISKLAAIAEEQWGFVTRRQAEKAGVSPATFKRLIRDGVLERTGPAVYRLAGAPLPDHVELRSAWLQLAPDIPVWERRPEQGIVSHRSAASIYGIGHLPADAHEFILPARRQVRRPDVRIHRGQLRDDEWIILRGLPITRPSRIASDLLADREDPEAVGRVVADALRGVYDYAGTFAQTLAPHAAQLGLRRDDGVAVLRWLLDLVGDPETERWMEDARAVSTDITPEHLRQAAPVPVPPKQTIYG
jgi:putative AbiEi antitoxin of type IV toxin-antitoxin system